MTPDELLTTTRAVRRRLDLDRPVPLSLVEECLTIALQAPNGGNRQRWHWVVVTDPGLRAGIAKLYRSAFHEYRTTQSTVDGPVMDSAAYLAENLERVPVLVLGCLWVAGDLPAGNQAGLWGSLLPAAWSYALAARARGLGTAWTTIHLRHEREVAALLGLPAEVRQGVLIPTAYALGGPFRPAARRPLAAALHVNGWALPSQRGGR
jgi:nitroreductase